MLRVEENHFNQLPPRQEGLQNSESNVNGFFISVKEALVIVWLYIQYGLKSFIQFFSSDDANDIFEEGGLSVDTHNFAQRKDLIHFSQTPIDPLNNGGYCYGAVLFAAQQYFKNRNIQETAALFEGGVPRTGIEIQHTYDTTFTEAERLGPVTYKIVMPPVLAHADLNEKNLKINVPPQEALNMVSTLEEGVYAFVAPVLTPFGCKNTNFHALLLIKEKDSSYLLDPNFRFGESEKSGTRIMKRAFQYYAGELCMETPRSTCDKIIYCFEYFFHMISGDANPPFMGTPDGFNISKLTPRA